MCQLIFAQGKMPEQRHLENSWDNNPHGGGILIQAPDKPAVVFRSMDRTEFLAYCSATTVPDGGNAIIHFRLRSHGTTTLDNVHPFFIYERDAYLFHNGCVSIDAPDGRSDTYAVARLLGEAGITTSTLKMLGKLESSSRFIVAAAHGNKAWGVNTKLGSWNDDHTIWYSNTSHTYMKTTDFYSGTYNPHKRSKSYSYKSWGEVEWRGSSSSRYSYDYWHDEDDYPDTIPAKSTDTTLSVVPADTLKPLCCWCGNDVIDPVQHDGEIFCKDCLDEYELYMKDVPTSVPATCKVTA